MVVTRHTQVFTNNLPILALFVPKYLDLLTLLCPVAKGKLEVLSEQRCKPGEAGLPNKHSKKSKSNLEVLGPLEGNNQT